MDLCSLYKDFLVCIIGVRLNRVASGRWNHRLDERDDFASNHALSLVLESSLVADVLWSTRQRRLAVNNGTISKGIWSLTLVGHSDLYSHCQEWQLSEKMAWQWPSEVDCRQLWG